jgi:hypothetical protein
MTKEEVASMVAIVAILLYVRHYTGEGALSIILNTLPDLVEVKP